MGDKTRAHPALASTQPVYGYLEAEWLMDIILRSGHEEAQYLVNKLVGFASDQEQYAKLLGRVQDQITLSLEGMEKAPLQLYNPRRLRQLAMARYPTANEFEAIGVDSPLGQNGAGPGWSFSNGHGETCFIAPDGCISTPQPDRAHAIKAFDAYWKPVRP